jgi:hypothetical protein
MAPTRSNRLVPAFAASVLVVLLGASSVLFGVCGPFTDVAADAFCPFVLEIFYLGITTGTTPTTYDPTSNVNRLQMAAFLSRSVDGVLKRGGRRAALDQYWTTQNDTVLGLTTVGFSPQLLKSDGADIWVANASGGGTVSRVRANDGKLLETWTGALEAVGVLVAMGRILVTGFTSPGNLYMIDPSQVAGAVTTVASNLGVSPEGIAFDGARVWTANVGSPGSVSIVTPGATTPWTVTTVTTGFPALRGVLYDGANVWVTNIGGAGTLLKLDSAGAILQTVTVGAGPEFPVFDGTNIWVPNANSSSVSVVRASSGAVLQTLTGNGLNDPFVAAFDGERVLITNQSGNSVSLWKAADLTALGFFATGSSTVPVGACSDGINFWITLNATRHLARF